MGITGIRTTYPQNLSFYATQPSHQQPKRRGSDEAVKLRTSGGSKGW
ncbi:8473_t:CDS:2 [Rhizophagus irregularis]|nr:8473_t:CDS:2 [Rhizophagus irregularis]